eukprot:2357092-Amphidinium_carterae.1
MVVLQCSYLKAVLLATTFSKDIDHTRNNVQLSLAITQGSNKLEGLNMCNDWTYVQPYVTLALVFPYLCCQWVCSSLVGKGNVAWKGTYIKYKTA